MKKVLILAVMATLAAGCASSANKTTTANQPLTLQQALQKSAETRQKLQEAQQSYENARRATESAKAASSSASVTDQIKKQIGEQIETSKNQVDAEVQAWKDVLK